MGPANCDTYKSCWQCIHLKYRTPKERSVDYDKLGDDYCDAFPDRIPEEVYNNGHYEPRPDLGQSNDMIFVPKIDEFKEEIEWMEQYELKDYEKQRIEVMKQVIAEYEKQEASS
jgi:hypothetical protein